MKYRTNHYFVIFFKLYIIRLFDHFSQIISNNLKTLKMIHKQFNIVVNKQHKYIFYSMYTLHIIIK